MLILTRPVDQAQKGRDIDPTFALWMNCFIVIKWGALELQAHNSASYCKPNMTVISALIEMLAAGQSSLGYDMTRNDERFGNIQTLRS